MLSAKARNMSSEHFHLLDARGAALCARRVGDAERAVAALRLGAAIARASAQLTNLATTARIGAALDAVGVRRAQLATAIIIGGTPLTVDVAAGEALASIGAGVADVGARAGAAVAGEVAQLALQ